jgi:hypothetical protein
MNLRIYFDPRMKSIDIDSKDIRYGNIKDMYKTGNGHGLQCSEDLNFKNVQTLCAEISTAIYKYCDTLEPKEFTQPK